ncbi:MAG: chorismate mutase [Vicinamibacterales bacterium]
MHVVDEDPGAGEAVSLHRRHIDRIDRTIVALLAERMRLGLALGAIKREHGWPTRSFAREAEVLALVRAAVAGPLSEASVERIFTAIIEETAARQEDGRG